MNSKIKDMNILVTGGGGFLGSHIIRYLQELNCTNIRSIGRKPQPELKKLGVDVRSGDIRNYEDVYTVCDSIDILFHTAAKAGIWGQWHEFFDINVKGTENVLKAARKRGVKYLIYTSSPSIAYSPYRDCKNIDENYPMPSGYPAYYPKTKRIAEEIVLQNNTALLKTISLRPHLLWGVGDPHLLPRLIRKAKQKRLAVIGTGKNTVDLTCVKNAAAAHIQAAEALVSDSFSGGKAYFISDGHPTLLWQWINKLLVMCGLEPIKRKIPFATAYLAGAAYEFTYSCFRLQEEPPITRFTAGQLAFSHYFNIEAAKKDFGYKTVVNPDDELQKTIEWIKTNF